jgi:ribose 5-phosphate isomerase A
MRIGLGTGSTVAYFLEALGRRVRTGELPGIVGVPTSVRTEERAEELGIPVSTLEAVGSLDVTVDGADEVDPDLDLIKGLGGALLREKMVAQATREFIVIADESKAVERLGTRAPVPLEVVSFSWKSHLPFLRDLGAEVTLREYAPGDPYLTDNGNFILDCRFPDGISNPRGLQASLAFRAGVVESGLFLDLATEAVMGGEGGVRWLRRKKGGGA